MISEGMDSGLFRRLPEKVKGIAFKLSAFLAECEMDDDRDGPIHFRYEYENSSGLQIRSDVLVTHHSSSCEMDGVQFSTSSSWNSMVDGSITFGTWRPYNCNRCNKRWNPTPKYRITYFDYNYNFTFTHAFSQTEIDITISELRKTVSNELKELFTPDVQQAIENILFDDRSLINQN